METNDKSLWNKTPNEITVAENVKVQLGIAVAGVIAVAGTTYMIGAMSTVKEKYQKAKRNRQALKAKKNK